MKTSIAAALLLLSPFYAEAADVYIGLTYTAGGEAPLVGLAPVTPLREGNAEDEELGRKMQGVVESDLLWSRYFRLDTEGPDPGKELMSALDAWKAKGAAALTWGRASTAGGKAFLEGRLYDLQNGKSIFEKRYETEKDNWRALAHAFSDEVVRQLTGRPGIAKTRIAFVGDQTGRKEVSVVDYDGEGLAQLTKDRNLTLLPRWSRDGKRLAYTTYRFGNPDIYELDMLERKPRPLMARQGLNVPGGYSPDGTSLLMTASYTGHSANLYLLNLETKAPKQITFHSGVDSSGSFSPDGREVAFVSDRSGNPQIHVLDVETGRVRRLTDLNLCDSPSWQPTGEWIVFAGRPGLKDKIDLYIVDPTGTRLKQLTRSSGSNENPSWSPDGRFIAFTSTRDGRRRLYVMDADGSAPRLVGDIPGNVYTPSWSPQ